MSTKSNEENKSDAMGTTHTLPKLPPSDHQMQVFDDVAKAKAVALRNAGYKYVEIAEHLGANINSVKSYIHRVNNDTPRCAQCSKPLPKSATKKRKFCSDKCRIKWWNDHRDLHEKSTTNICLFCGKEFKSYGPSRKYCSAECYNESRMKDSPRALVAKVCLRSWKRTILQLARSNVLCIAFLITLGWRGASSFMGDGNIHRELILFLYSARILTISGRRMIVRIEDFVFGVHT